MSNNKWDFRPSILSVEEYKDAAMSRGSFLKCYQEDNQRADESGVGILKRRQESKFRTLQWNLNGWAGDHGRLNSLTYSKHIIEAILEADADCVILNEYHWNDPGQAHAQMEKTLRQHGYVTQICGTVSCPTFVATRWYTSSQKEVILSGERSAMVLHLMDETGDELCVVGTHLDHRDGTQRQREMQNLIQQLFHHDRNPQEEAEEGNSIVGEDTRVILAGDLNQQRQTDYPVHEWEQAIAPNMVSRKTCYDDGVAGLLKEEDFSCAWDHPSVQTNWNTEFPPSTHWSGTIVDYSYGRHVQADSMSISPAGWSDHRMTVVDWKW